MKNFHPYHMVEMSPWPIMSSFSILTFVLSLILWMHNHNLFFSLIVILMSIFAYLWWRDIIRESTLQGYHNNLIMKSLKWGMILFITSEVMFFLSFFWGFYHSSLSPSLEIGSFWPPIGINTFNPFSIPLLNTAILVSSGASITWCHHAIIHHNYFQAKLSLLLTITLGLYFTLLQGFEYQHASFSISDSCYGTTFFVATGFHGLHVLIGTTFLTICFLRLLLLHFSESHHLGFEMSAWYWHFVDIVWLLLFLSIYWWGN